MGNESSGKPYTPVGERNVHRTGEENPVPPEEIFAAKSLFFPEALKVTISMRTFPGSMLLSEKP
jgi:hypothetical protein